MDYYAHGIVKRKGEALTAKEKNCLEKGTVTGVRLVFEITTEIHDVLLQSPDPRHRDYLLPMMASAGVPVFARLEIENPIERKNKETYKIAQVMSDPDETGLSRDLFQDFRTMVPVLLFRKDNVPFTTIDYCIVHEIFLHIFGSSDQQFHVTPQRLMTWARKRAKEPIVPIVPDGCDKKSYLLDEVLMESKDKICVPRPPLLNSETVRLLYAQGNTIPNPTLMSAASSGFAHGVTVSGIEVYVTQVPFDTSVAQGNEMLPIAEHCGLPVLARLNHKARPELHSAYRMIRLMRDMKRAWLRKDNKEIGSVGVVEGL